MKKNTQKVKWVILIFTVLFLNIDNGYSQWIQVGEDIDGEAAFDRSGRSVSISEDGTIVAIGASGNDGNGTDSGHVRVYQNINDTWVQLGQDIDGSAVGVFFGNRVSLSSNGLRLAVQSTRNTSANIDSGETIIYDFIGGSWTQVGSGILGAGESDGFNGRIDLSSDGLHIAIGSISNNSFSGIARVFSFDGTDWVQTGTDFIGNTNDQLGRSVSLSANGMRLAIATPRDNTLGSGLGSARVYEYNGSTWVELGTGIAGEVFNDFPSGVSLSSDGNRIAMGSPGNDANGFLSGHVRIFEYDGSNWVQMGNNIEGESIGTGDQIGVHERLSLSSNGLTVAIGSTGNNGRTGRVRVFRFNGLSWVQQGVDIDGEASGDDSGGSVSISANGIVAIGATENDGSADLAGHVRVFEFPESLWTGSPITFSLNDNSDPTQEVNQDRITDKVWLTRADTGGIFNISSETDYTSLVSPVDTEWAFGTIADIETLTFDTWENTIGGDPQSMIDLDMVLHLITDNIFIDIKFTSWTGGVLSRSQNNTFFQNGLSYQRSTNQTLSTEAFRNEEELRLYPNPSSNFIRIIGFAGTKKYTIYDIIGTKLKVNETRNNELIDIQNLAKGLYFISFDNEQSFKFIKN